MTTLSLIPMVIVFLVSIAGLLKMRVVVFDIVDSLDTDMHILKVIIRLVFLLAALAICCLLGCLIVLIGVSVIVQLTQ